MILTEVHLLESRVYRGIGNLSKSKAALTSARTAANSIYCPPHLQASLDLQSGILHAEDKDYKTAYSYFYETFENLSSQDDPGALGALKYMLLCKVMLNLVSRVSSHFGRLFTCGDSLRMSTLSFRLSWRSSTRNSGKSRVCAQSRRLIRTGTLQSSRKLSGITEMVSRYEGPTR